MNRPLLITILALSLAGCSPDKKAAAPEKTPVEKVPAVEGLMATVNGVPITEAEVDAWVGASRRRSPSQAMRKEILDSVIEAELALQYGAESGLNDGSYRSRIEKLELELVTIKRREMLRRVVGGELAQGLEVTDEDARAYFDASGATLAQEYRLWLLQFSDIEKGRAALERIEKGETFAAVAARGVVQEEGKPPWELPWMPWRQLPTHWLAPVTALAPGQHTGLIVDSRNTVQLLHLVEKRTVTDASFETMAKVVKKRLQEQKLEEKRDAWFAGQRNKSTVVIVGEQSATK